MMPAITARDGYVRSGRKCFLCAKAGFSRGSGVSGAASHPADQLVAGKTVLYPPCLELISINRIRQKPRRLISYFLIPAATQHVDHLLPSILHAYHQPPAPPAAAVVQASGGRPRERLLLANRPWT